MREAATDANAHHEQTVDLLAWFTAVDPLIQSDIDAMAKVKDIPAPFDARDLIDPSLH